MFGRAFFRRALIRNYAPASVYLGVHWQPYAENIIPPFIANHHHDNPVMVENKVLVYLPFENLDSVVDYLKDFPEREFYCYHPDALDCSIGNIHLRAPSRVGFLNDLANAGGVIGNAGFELASEALQLGKKLLLKPLGKQFEQGINAQTLLSMGAAHVMSYLNPNAMMIGCNRHRTKNSIFRAIQRLWLIGCKKNNGKSWINCINIYGNRLI